VATNLASRRGSQGGAMYKLTDTFVLILLSFAVFLSVAYTTLNKLFAVFSSFHELIQSRGVCRLSVCLSVRL